MCFGRITRSLKSQLMVPFYTINSTGTLTHDKVATLFTIPYMRCEIQRHPAHPVSMRVFHTTILERHNHPLREGCGWLEIPGVFASCLKPRGCSQVDKGRTSPENFRKKRATARVNRQATPTILKRVSSLVYMCCGTKSWAPEPILGSAGYPRKKRPKFRVVATPTLAG